MAGAQEPEGISTRLVRIAQQARQNPEMVFTSLNHHLDEYLLHAAFREINKGGASGVDGMTAREYATDLDGRLRDLLGRAKSGRYQAPPVRRVHIPKGQGPETRPIGIPTLEDRILQQAVRMILEAVYEQDFLPCSYGFRPGRSAHDALEALWKEIGWRGGWILDVDVRKFFDTLDHVHLRKLIVISEERLVELVSEIVAREVAAVSQDSIEPTGGSTTGSAHRPWYTFKTLGELVGVDERTLRRWEKEGRVPAALRIGGCVRWPSDVIDRWVLEGCPAAE